MSKEISRWFQKRKEKKKKRKKLRQIQALAQTLDVTPQRNWRLLEVNKFECENSERGKECEN